MNRSNAYILAGLMAVAVPTLSMAGRVPVVLLESSVESTADEVSLPSAESGILTVRACSGCAVQTFYFAKDRVLIAGGRQLELAQMITALRRAGDAPVTVQYRRSDSAVTRVVLLEVSTSAAAQ